MIIINIILFSIALVTESFSFKNLWGWFIAPIVGVSITPIHAFGLIVTSALFTHTHYDKEKDFSYRCLLSTCLSLSYWGIGWIVHILM